MSLRQAIAKAEPLPRLGKCNALQQVRLDEAMQERYYTIAESLDALEILKVGAATVGLFVLLIITVAAFV